MKEGKTRQGKKSSYRHIPHSEKPPHLVAKRNERERKRVQAVNGAFLRLRKYVPHEPRNKRLSKFKTLKFAIQYIQLMQDMIQSHDYQLASATDKRKNMASYNSDTAASEILLRTSANSQRPDFDSNGPPRFQNLSLSNFIPVIHHQSCESRDGQRKCDVPTYSQYSAANVSDINNCSSENFGHCFEDNAHRPPEYPFYNRCLFVEPSHGHPRYQNQYRSMLYHIKDHHHHHHSHHIPSKFGISPPCFGDTSSNGSPVDFPLAGQNQDCGHRSLCYYSDYSSQPQTPSTSSHADSSDDCNSDISSTAYHESIAPLESIPNFHQVISFLDTRNYNQTTTGNRNDFADSHSAYVNGRATSANDLSACSIKR